MVQLICVFFMVGVTVTVTVVTGAQISEGCYISDSGNSDEPLFLTPLIQDKNRPRQEIQNMARVDRSQFGDVESFAGFLTVDKKFNSNLFFWYFPAEENKENAPVVLWLQGGPGSSSLLGLYTELGPLSIDENMRLVKRNYTWNRDHNLIFIDNPVGTGFSFTDNEAGYAQNEDDVGRNLHEAMMQLYELFEWDESLDFWITGESYAGKYVPALGYYIHKAETANSTRVRIPLKGLAIGNGLCDPLNQLKHGDLLYQLGLVDEHGLSEFRVAEQKISDCIEEKDLLCAFDGYDSMLLGQFHHRTLFYNLTGFEVYYNILNSKNDGAVEHVDKFMQCPSTRRALHAGNRKFMANNIKVLAELRLDVVDTVAPWLSELLDSYTICFYNGQLDIVLAYPLTRNFLGKLQFAGAEEYKTAERHFWYVDDELAGYVKQAGNLIEIMVRNGGHMIPMDQPKWMYDLIYQLTHYKTVE